MKKSDSGGDEEMRGSEEGECYTLLKNSVNQRKKRRTTNYERIEEVDIQE